MRVYPPTPITIIDPLIHIYRSKNNGIPALIPEDSGGGRTMFFVRTQLFAVPEKPEIPDDNSVVLLIRLGNESTPPDPLQLPCRITGSIQGMESGMWQEM